MSDKGTVKQLTPEGVVMAYSGVIMMAVACIVIGAKRSTQTTGKSDNCITLTTKKALLLPIYAVIGHLFLLDIDLTFGDVPIWVAIMYYLFLLTVEIIRRRVVGLFRGKAPEPILNIQTFRFRVTTSGQDGGDEMKILDYKFGWKILVAYWFLFGFLFEKIFVEKDPKDGAKAPRLLYNLILTSMGVAALSRIVKPFTRFFPEKSGTTYGFVFTRYDKQGSSKDFINWKFGFGEQLDVGICSIVGFWYLSSNHWIANNVLAMSLVVGAIDMLRLNSVGAGCILLILQTLYEFFLLFGTNIMAKVKTEESGPIMLKFPADLIKNGFAATNCVLIGIGAVIFSGIFIALLLHFDKTLKRNSKLYFYTSLLAYTFGLVAAFTGLEVFEPGHAMLIAVGIGPLSGLTPLVIALAEGDLLLMLRCRRDSEQSVKTAETENEEQERHVSESAVAVRTIADGRGEEKVKEP